MQGVNMQKSVNMQNAHWRSPGSNGLLGPLTDLGEGHGETCRKHQAIGQLWVNVGAWPDVGNKAVLYALSGVEVQHTSSYAAL